MKVNTITSNEQHVRLEIFEGRLPLDEAGKELIRIARAQLASEEIRHNYTRIELVAARRERDILLGVR